MAAGSLASLAAQSSSETLVAPFSGAADNPNSPAAPESFFEFLTALLKTIIRGDHELPCPLPAEFCAGLLRDDDNVEDTVEPSLEGKFSAGVPEYPLYKCLARGLCEWIETVSFPRSSEPMAGIVENDTRNAKLGDWTQKVVELEPVLLALCEGVGFRLHVQEPYFTQLKDGAKTVEGRCASGAYTKLRTGDVLLVNDVLLLSVKDVRRYSSFHEMLDAEGLSAVLPGVGTLTEGVQIYRRFYSEAREQVGVLGIHVQHPSDQRQPYEVLFDILNELQVDGVRALLGMRSTMGSVEDALPPPPSALLSSFSLINNETVAGSKLTVGARALAKHVHRSSDGWWGTFTGTEIVKNELSLKKLRQMMDNATWMNVHVVPVPVFEIRVREGYGARWSADGSQFRGFLEPPMEEGYLHKWRH